MVYFIKDAIEGKASAHKYFVRFGKGQYNERGALRIDNKKEKVLVKGSYENVPSILVWLSQQLTLNVSGKIMSKSNIEEAIEKNGLKIIGKKEKSRIIEYEVEGNCKNLDKLEELAYFLLLDARANGIELKCKKSLPRPSAKSSLKIDDKFFSLQLNKDLFDSFKREFLFDVPESKKIEVMHSIIIDNIIIPKEFEKTGDFEKMRLEARKKGKIIRRIKTDSEEIIKEYNIFI